MEESDSHKSFARIQNEGIRYKDIQKILSYDVGDAWQMVKQKAARRRRKYVMRVCEIAASIIIVLGVVVVVLQKQETAVIPVSKVEEITPGRSTAKLIVASGDVYHLDSLNQVDLEVSLAENGWKRSCFY